MTTASSARSTPGGAAAAPEGLAAATARLRVELVELHRELIRSGLVVWTAGNVSARVFCGFHPKSCCALRTSGMRS